jgi:hypothetical protein
MSNSKNVHKLSNETLPEFDIFGIASHENDYRISWAINEALGLRLTKSDNHKSFNKRINEEQEFSMYISNSGEIPALIKLISNRCENGFLLEELKNIDYILLIEKSGAPFPIADLVAQIRSISFISTIFPLDIKLLKNKNRLF